MGAQLRNVYIGYQAQISPSVFGIDIGEITWRADNIPGCPAAPPNLQKCDGAIINNALSPMNGQNTPNMVGAFPRGANASGGTGGASSATIILTGVDADVLDCVPGGSNRLHKTYTVNTLPPYVDLVPYMRIY